MSTTNHGSPIPQSASGAPTHTNLMISPEAIAAESFSELASGAPPSTEPLPRCADCGHAGSAHKPEMHPRGYGWIVCRDCVGMPDICHRFAPVASPLPESRKVNPEPWDDDDVPGRGIADEGELPDTVPPVALPSDDESLDAGDVEFQRVLSAYGMAKASGVNHGYILACRVEVCRHVDELRSRLSAAETRMTELRVLYEERVSRVVELEADLASLRSRLTEAEALLRRINLEDSNLDNWYDDIRPDVDNFLQPKP